MHFVKRLVVIQADRYRSPLQGISYCCFFYFCCLCCCWFCMWMVVVVVIIISTIVSCFCINSVLFSFGHSRWPILELRLWNCITSRNCMICSGVSICKRFFYQMVIISDCWNINSKIVIVFFFFKFYSSSVFYWIPI